MQLYADAGLITTLTDNVILPAGLYYVKITSSETLGSAPTISMAAQGTANDVTHAAMTLLPGNDYSYTYIVSTDAASTGTVLVNFSVT